MVALEAQVKQLGLQVAQDCERLAKDRTLTLQLLHKVSLILAQFKIVLQDMTVTCMFISDASPRSRRGCASWRRSTTP